MYGVFAKIQLSTKLVEDKHKMRAYLIIFQHENKEKIAQMLSLPLLVVLSETEKAL